MIKEQLPRRLREKLVAHRDWCESTCALSDTLDIIEKIATHQAYISGEKFAVYGESNHTELENRDDA